MLELLLLIPLLILVLWEPVGNSKYTAGYSHGYAVGFNPNVDLKSKLTTADWRNQYYALGYDDGYFDGVVDYKKTNN